VSVKKMPEYCVTGGTGLIAAYIVKMLLEKGHTVRATVRNPEDLEKVGFLWQMNGAKERLKLVKADLLVKGSFNDAVEGADGVFHAASPEYLIKPCVEGVANLLKSCSKASTVKRVVLTSSCSSIRYRDDVQNISPLNESHFSDLEYCQRNNLWYPYAKTLAEREAWLLAEKYNIDLVVVNSSFVVGPFITPEPTSTLLVILAIVKGLLEEYPNQRLGFVHIDDVVNGHILAMEDDRASGRLIVSSSVAHWSEIIEMLKAKYPSYRYASKCSTKEGENNPHSMDCSKIIQLGIPGFKTIPQMFDDCIQRFQEKGLL
ncbi:hypothetical protein GIB67_012672, partial [Kingdonia uniflora]